MPNEISENEINSKKINANQPTESTQNQRNVRKYLSNCINLTRFLRVSDFLITNYQQYNLFVHYVQKDIFFIT